MLAVDAATPGTLDLGFAASCVKAPLACKLQLQRADVDSNKGMEVQTLDINFLPVLGFTSCKGAGKQCELYRRQTFQQKREVTL